MGEGYEENGNRASLASDRQLPIEFLRPSANNPRSNFDDAAIDELTKSIREKGVIQPILVRQINDRNDSYEIVAGERRWRAAQKAGIHAVPVVIKVLSDREALEIALIENIQRENLNAIEEAVAYEHLRQEYSYTQENLADVLGKSRSHVANTLRLLNLPQTVQEYVRDGELTAGHVRTLLTAGNPEELAKKILAEGLSVRGAERIARQVAGKPRQLKKLHTGAASTETPKDADTVALEKALTDVLGLKVEIEHAGDKGGRVTISYKTLEQLDAICEKLKTA
jgi:ParB family transcriptional regulator, chromosome partitioning protein